MLANVGHELRTPLGVVLGMLELALGTALSAEQREYLEKAHASARHLGGLVEDLLDLARIEQGPVRLEEQAFSLPVLVGETLRAFLPRAREKGLELLCEIAPAVPDGVRGDPARLRQVLAQLLDNALKFTERGQVELRLRAAEGAAEWLQFSLSDTGVGIVPGDLQRIFEPFTQVDGSNTRRHGGAGLGLGLSARLVQLMGGRIRAESQPGRGSTFHFEVRLPADPAGNAATEQDLAALAGQPVLVLDGQEASRRTLGELLEALGTRPTLTNDPAQALDALNRAARLGAPFGIAIVDGNLRGSVVFRARRAEDDPLLAATPHVVLESPGEPPGVFRSGPGPRLTRPVTRPELLAALRRALSEPPPAAGNVQPLAAEPPDRPLHVLVAEDNPLNAFMAVRMLESLGHRGEVVGSGRQAVESLAVAAFDAVLMDVQMPEMDGLEATRVIRAAERGRPERARILALTALTSEQDLAQCLEAGMDGYLAKPFSVSALRAALAGSQATRLGAAVAPPDPPAIDRPTLGTQLGDDAEAIQEVLEAFVSEAPGHLARLQAAVDGADASALEHWAHRLKGALLWLRARRAAACAEALEQLGRSGDLGLAQPMLEELERELQRVLAEARAGGDPPGQAGSGSEVHPQDGPKLQS